MIRKWFQSIMNHDFSLQERMFHLFTGLGMITLAAMFLLGIIFKENIVNQLVLLACLIYLIVVVSMKERTHRINLCAMLVAILLFILFPLNFFSAGGLGGSAPLWFVFCFVFVSLVISGKEKFIFLGLCMVIVPACFYIGYEYPQYIVQHTREVAYIDAAFSVVVAGSIISAIIMLQNRVYREENKITSQQKQEIEELNQAENRFFSSMSHEIRTPINTIIGLNEVILRSNISDDVAENARNIQGASKMLLSLVNDILDVSKMQSGKMEVVDVSYETGAFFSDIVNMIWIKAKEKGLEFHLKIDPSIPSMLCGDEMRIKQVLINILNNSVKYTKQGSVTLSVRCDRISTNKVRVYYDVTDTGIGIKKESIPHLFDAFQRIEESKNRYIEGTGLGLSIVKQLVELMNGEIAVNSVYTQGSTFLVTLEQEIIDENELGTFTLEAHANRREKMGYKQSFTAPEARLLIVDDNEMNLKVASKLLSETKIQIDTVTSGAECLKLTQIKKYDGILMDHLMPEMDGIECLHALRTQVGGLCQETPVIALTANAGSENQLLYEKEGFNGYLAKPVNGALLEATVLKMLPKELTVINGDIDQAEIGKDVLLFDRRQRVPMAITTDSVSDLPKEITERMGISVNPYYVCTEEGRFLDGKEMKADDLLVYLERGKKGASLSPEVEDYERFFAQELSKSQNIIHIAMAKNASVGYKNACEAAKSFENVTVVNSEYLSSSMGMMAMYAANMAKEHASKEEIITMLEEMKSHMACDFILDNTKWLCRSGRIPKKVQIICDALLIHPVITLRGSKMTVGDVHFGSYEHSARRYIRKSLGDVKRIDRRLLFLTYAGMDERQVLHIKEMVQQCCQFEKIYLQKASSAISSNCGAGAFGLLFLRKGEGGKLLGGITNY